MVFLRPLDVQACMKFTGALAKRCHIELVHNTATLNGTEWLKRQ